MRLRRRWLLLTLAAPCYVFAHMFVATIVLALVAGELAWGDLGEVLRLIGDAEWWGYVGVPALLLTTLQGVFLIPLFSRTPPRGARSRSLTVSLVLAAGIAAGLCAGVAWAAVEVFELVVGDVDSTVESALWLASALMLVGSWVAWSALLLLFVRGIWADRVLGRLVGLLLAGTALEALVVLPVDIMVRRRTSCYCAEGTFFSLGLAAMAALWLTGPGIVIALGARRHRLWRDRACERCGYPKGPSPGEHCPECGHPWLEPPPSGPWWKRLVSARCPRLGRSKSPRRTAEDRGEDS